MKRLDPLLLILFILSWVGIIFNIFLFPEGIETPGTTGLYIVLMTVSGLLYFSKFTPKG